MQNLTHLQLDSPSFWEKKSLVWKSNFFFFFFFDEKQKFFIKDSQRLLTGNFLFCFWGILCSFLATQSETDVKISNHLCIIFTTIRSATHSKTLQYFPTICRFYVKIPMFLDTLRILLLFIISLFSSFDLWATLIWRAINSEASSFCLISSMMKRRNN